MPKKKAIKKQNRKQKNIEEMFSVAKTKRSDVDISETTLNPTHKRETFNPPISLYSREEVFQTFQNNNWLKSKDISSIFSYFYSSLLNSPLTKDIPEEDVFRNFEFCLFSYLFASKNALFHSKYKPFNDRQLFSREVVDKLRGKLKMFFRNKKKDDVHYNSRPNNSNAFLKTARYEYNSSFEEGEESNKLCIYLQGEDSSGKSTVIDVFCKNYGFEKEVVDFSMYKSLKEIVNKYNLAINMSDVKMKMNNNSLNRVKGKNSIGDFFELCGEQNEIKDRTNINKRKKKKFFDLTYEYKSKRVKRKKKRRKREDSDEEFVVNEDKIWGFGGNCFDDFEDRKKIFVCCNLDYLFKNDYLNDKKEFKKKLEFFLQFVHYSSYPFIFIGNKMNSVLFGNHFHVLDILPLKETERDKILLNLAVIAFIEKNFGRLSDELTKAKLFSIKNKEEFVDVMNKSIFVFSDNIQKNKKILKMPDLDKLNFLIDSNSEDLYKILIELDLNIDSYFDDIEEDLIEGIYSQKKSKVFNFKRNKNEKNVKEEKSMEELNASLTNLINNDRLKKENHFYSHSEFEDFFKLKEENNKLRLVKKKEQRNQQRSFFLQ